MHRKVNFQHDLDDVMCQTWIWYWVYFRVIRKMPPREIANFVKTLVHQEMAKKYKNNNFFQAFFSLYKDRSLNHIHKFNCWLSDLYRVGFLCRETQSQTDVGESYWRDGIFPGLTHLHFLGTKLSPNHFNRIKLTFDLEPEVSLSYVNS